VPLRVYIETTIPSYYYDARPNVAQKHRSTRIWWDEHRQDFELTTSPAVIAELKSGNHSQKSEKLALVASLPILRPGKEIADIIAVYIRQFVMPSEPVADAAHLAFASYYGCDVLLTWNCAHLANASKYVHIRTVNQKLGLPAPLITTPLQLMGVDLDES
jgi:predicted nucleic acid-binding protein